MDLHGYDDYLGNYQTNHHNCEKGLGPSWLRQSEDPHKDDLTGNEAEVSFNTYEWR